MAVHRQASIENGTEPKHVYKWGLRQPSPVLVLSSSSSFYWKLEVVMMHRSPSAFCRELPELLPMKEDTGQRELVVS